MFGIHDCGENYAVMNCWPEFVSQKGSNEVISCLEVYLSKLPERVTTLYLYSDGCPGQNKNIYLVHYLFTLVKLGEFQHIQHHFPVRGHSFLPNDRDFGRTEMQKRKAERVYTSDQWYEVMKGARRRNPFHVHEMPQAEIKAFGDHTSSYFKKSIKSGKKSLNVQNVWILDYSSSHPNEIWVKYHTYMVQKMKTGTSLR